MIPYFLHNIGSEIVLAGHLPSQEGVFDRYMPEMLALLAFGEHKANPHEGFLDPRKVRRDNVSST